MRNHNATQEELGNYPQKACSEAHWKAVERQLRETGNITVQDAAWLWGVAKIVWWEQPNESERITAAWIADRRAEWSKLYGQHVADRLETFVRRSLSAGTITRIPASQLPKVFEELQAEAASKVAGHQKSAVKWTGYDPATKGADVTVFTLLDREGRHTKAFVTARLGAWVKLSLPEGEQWFISQGKAILPATRDEASKLNAEWSARERLQRTKPDERDLNLPYA